MYDAEEIEPVKRLLHRVLDTVVDVYALNSVDLPERRYVQIGGTTNDCEQVTASLVQLYLGGPGDQAVLPQPCDGLRTAVMAIEIVRCVPVPSGKGTPPSPEAIEEKADIFLVDSWLLMEAIPKTFESEVPGFSVLADVSIGERSGGYQGITLNLIAPVV